MYLEQQQQEADLTWLGALGCTWALVQVGSLPHLFLHRSRESPLMAEKELPLLKDILLCLCDYHLIVFKDHEIEVPD